MKAGIVTRILICLGILAAICGCATLYGSNNREVAITTVPSGAEVYMDGVFYGKTPNSVLISNVGPFGQKVTLKKPGYKDKTFIVETSFQNVGYWNIIVFPGFFFDAVTGCMFQVKQGDYNLTLELQKTESASISNESSVVTLKAMHSESSISARPLTESAVKEIEK